MATLPRVLDGNGKNKWLGLALGGSSGVAAYALLEIARADPKSLIALMGSWGPLFAIVIVCLVVMDRWGERWFGRLLETTEKSASAGQANAEAQRSMAEAINRIAARDDNADRERELLLNDMAFVLKEVRKEVGQIREEQLAQAIARGTGAAGGMD